MKRERNYYVYAYTRLDTNTFFYIGKGKGDRYKRIDCRSKHFKRICNKVDCVVEIIKDNLTEDEALELEQKMIEQLTFEEGYSIELDQYKNFNKDGSHLVNMTYGGEGISGYRHKPETIEKCTHIGKSNGMYGKKGELSPHYGKVYDEDHKNKIKLSNPKRKEVYCVELDRSFNSFREAEKIIKRDYDIIISHASISAICKGKNKYGGYYEETRIPVKLHFKLK